MKRVLFGSVAATVLVVTFAFGAAAQDRIFAFRGAFQDVVLGEQRSASDSV